MKNKRQNGYLLGRESLGNGMQWHSPEIHLEKINVEKNFMSSGSQYVIENFNENEFVEEGGSIWE